MRLQRIGIGVHLAMGVAMGVVTPWTEDARVVVVCWAAWGWSLLMSLLSLYHDRRHHDS